MIVTDGRFSIVFVTLQAVGATKAGKKYLLTKTLLQSSAALNLAMFLLLKSDESMEEPDGDTELDTGAATSSLIQYHPVMKRLEQCNSLAQKLEEKVEKRVPGLQGQLDNLIKASLLMESMQSADADSDEESDGNDEGSQGASIHEDEESKPAASNAIEARPASSSEGEASSEEEDEEDISRSMINNARFGLRPNEIAQDKMARASSSNKRRQRRAVPSDFGDDVDAAADKTMAARSLSSTINSIEQRAASRKKKVNSATEALVEHEPVDEDLRRGIEMMEAEMGRLSDEDDDAGENYADDINSDGDDGGGFYAEVAKKSKAKKRIKKTLYQVAPKYPRLDPEVEGTWCYGLLSLLDLCYISVRPLTVISLMIKTQQENALLEGIS